MIDNHYGATNFTNLRPPNLSWMIDSCWQPIANY
jgi:hypothetical protein